MRNMTRHRPADILGGADQPGDSYLETNGVRLRYREQGQGPAVVLLHGWTLDLDMWNPQAAALARNFRVVRLDRRGFGLSSGEPSIAADVADLRDLCRHQGIDTLALVGMSQGARVAVQFAAAFPRMVSCLILDGPPDLGDHGTVPPPPDLPYAHYCELARLQGLCAFREEWSRHPLTQLKTRHPEAYVLLAHMIARYPGRDLTHAGGHSDVPAATWNFRAVECPVLVINGEFDIESRRRTGKQLASQHPRAEWAAIPDGGHLCSLDHPDAYSDVLRQFLSRHTIPDSIHPRAPS